MIKSRGFANLLIAVIGIIILIRLSSIGFLYGHPDEVITIKVAERVVQDGTLDTNWKNADLPEYFKYPQFNFSSYNLFAAGVLALKGQVAPLSGFQTYKALRLVSGLLAIAVILLSTYLGRKLFNPATGYLGGVLVAVNPLLYQDSLYARPESFVTLLVLVFLATLWSKEIRSYLRVILASAILGLLAASKISMLALFPLLFLSEGGLPKTAAFSADLLGYIQDCFKRLYRHIWLIPLPFVLGFFIGAPFAVLNFNDFLYGFGKLSEQYNTGHWPHGLPDGTALERIAYSLGYFFPTMGFGLFVFAVVGALILLRARNFRPAFALAFFLFFFVWFSLYRTFFERNFSHILPLVIIVASYGFISVLRMPVWGGMRYPRSTMGALSAIGIALLIGPSVTTAAKLRFFALPGQYTARLEALRSDLEERYGVQPANLDWINDLSNVDSRFSGDCGARLIELPYAGDRYLSGSIEQFKKKDGYREVGRFESPFAKVSPSTLHTYFSPFRIFLYKDEDFSACEPNTPRFLPKTKVGDLQTIVDTIPALTWTVGGGYDLKVDPFKSGQYYASWSGNDAGTGSLRVTIDLKSEKYVVLPVITGPTSKNQFVEVRNHKSGDLIYSSGPMPLTLKWRHLLIPVPYQSGLVDIVAKDQGNGWGEWLGIGMPRKYVPEKI